MPDISFAGRVVIVTGGAGVLGTAYSRELARRGANVVVNDIGRAGDGRPAAEHLVAEIEGTGGSAVASTASITETDGPAELWELALERFGHVDAVVNNAGFAINKPLEEQTVEDFEQMRDVHLRGTYLLCKLAFPHMKERGYGRIVTMASSSGVFGLETQVPYGMFKTAVVGLTNELALEAEGTGVLVNAILPRAPKEGRTKASRTRLKLEAAAYRLDAEFVAPLLVYLVSDACERTHRVYSAAAGCYGEVFTGETPGWIAPGTDPPPAELIADHIDEITAERGYEVIRSIPEDIAYIVRRFAESRNDQARPVSAGAALHVGRVVAITGAGHGLGRAFALQLARDGASVVVNDLRDAGGAVDEIRASGGEAVAVEGSVADVDVAKRIVAAAVDTYGRIDGLVNNAGIVIGGTIEHEELEDFDRLLAVHTLGPFLCTRAAFPHMKQQGFGRILSVSSGAGWFGLPVNCGYAATKSAMIGLTNVLAIEGAEHGIRANALLPRARVGRDVPRATGKHVVPPEIEARIRPEYVAPLVSYLVSERCTATRGVFAATANWYGSVFTGLAPGWVSPRTEPPTAESIRDHLAEIEAADGYSVPTCVDDETDAVARRLEAEGFLSAASG